MVRLKHAVEKACAGQLLLLVLASLDVLAQEIGVLVAWLTLAASSLN